MTNDLTLKNLDRTIKLLLTSKKTVLFSGAGLSTPSGIPDFRSTKAGLWSADDSEEVASIRVFNDNPERFFKWFLPLARAIDHASPNAAHHAIAHLAEMKKITANITQNIDGLLQSAGCNPVYELHGSLKSVTCRNCGSHFPSGEMMSKYLNDGLIPHCINCHSVLKPDITFFGEDLPVDQWEPARRESIACDLMIVVGSSLTVFPAASLPELAFKNGAKLVILNRDPTHLDLKADVAHHGELAEFLPLLAEGI